jgi:hypothetical protein
MYAKCWQIIRDDSKRTFEICGQESNTNLFTNATHGMQRVGMNVSYMTPPVTNKNSTKESIKIIGYTKEPGLHDRLMKEYREKVTGSIDQYE